MKLFSRLVVLIALLVATAADAAWWINTDDRPRQIAPGVWHFSIQVPVYPVGQLLFVNAEYDFYDETTGLGMATNGMSVDYAFNGPGIDWTDSRTFLSIAPTLFNLQDGFIQGWSGWNIVKGKFEGTVYAAAPLLRVSFMVVADTLVQAKGQGHGPQIIR